MTRHAILDRHPQLEGNPLAMAMFCLALRDQGLHGDAMALGQAALSCAPDDMEVRDLVRAALSERVPAWHVPMLRDRPRNQCYAQAIERAVKPGMLVLEIGTGAGLLSLMAARAGARVVTCESNPMVAAAAREIVRRNGLDNRITIVGRRSTDLEIGVDLPERADLLISELFDDTLFGDDIMRVIRDARERLLTPEAPVLPARAALRCALVAVPRPQVALEDVEGFDLSPIALLQPPSIQAHSADPCSAPVTALPMDFDTNGDFGPTKQRIGLVSNGGVVTGVIQWLRIDFGGGIVFENNPFVTRSHWGCPVTPFVHPVDTQPGDTIEVDVRVLGTRVLMRLAGPPR